MKRNHILGLAFLAIFAFSAVLAASASAEETLLAEWLIGGEAVVALTSVETTGLLTLKAGTDVIDCEGALDGSIGANGEGEITEVLDVSKTVKIGAPLVQPALECKPEGENTCTNNPVLVWAVNLPWLTNLELMTVAGLPPFLNHLFKLPETGAQPGYEVECTLLGVKITQECTGLTSSSAENVGTDVVGKFNPAAPIESEKANCTVTGAGTGEIIGEGLTALLGAGTLTVSSV